MAVALTWTQMVDDLSRQPWKSKRTLWTDQTLQKLGGNRNDRLLKKNVLQDLAWTLLFQFLFDSPFRVLGDEGPRLEREWIQHYGQGKCLSLRIEFTNPVADNLKARE